MKQRSITDRWAEEDEIVFHGKQDIDKIEEVRKFNENHDASGRFASAGGGGASAIMDKIRNNVQGQSDDMLLSAWKMNKDSKARDENGNLLTLYHNTDAAGIETFRTQTEHGYGGLYMTDTQSVAQGFKGGTTYKLYADLKNPLVVDAGGKAYDSIEPPEGMGRKYSFGSKTVDTQAIAAYARDSGYDGVIVNNVKEPTGHGTDVIAFHPEQVKAVQNTAPTRDTSINKRDIDHIEETE